VPEQIIKLPDLIGKTIERTTDELECEYLGLFFTDGSFFRVAIDSGFDPGEESLVWFRQPTGWEQLKEFGLMSEEEYAQKKAKADAFLAERERQEYERLKAKFESEARTNDHP
jgi:hypothetical protein